MSLYKLLYMILLVYDSSARAYWLCDIISLQSVSFTPASFAFSILFTCSIYTTAKHIHDWNSRYYITDFFSDISLILNTTFITEAVSDYSLFLSENALTSLLERERKYRLKILFVWLLWKRNGPIRFYMYINSVLEEPKMERLPFIDMLEFNVKCAIICKMWNSRFSTYFLLKLVLIIINVPLNFL